MASPLGTGGSLTIQTDDQGSSIKVHIAEPPGVSADHLTLSTWGAYFILANHLHKIEIPSSDSATPSRVLELGAGTGLTGLSAAAIWKMNTILTDFSAIVPALAANIALNESILKQAGVTVEAGSLDWTDPASIALSTGKDAPLHQMEHSSNNMAQVIVAADVIYDEEHPELLVSTITRWLAPGFSSRVIFCYPLRMAYMDHIRDFWEHMEAAGLECCEEGKEDANEDWNEVADTPYEWCVWRWKG